jgi:hypothetical protein
VLFPEADLWQAAVTTRFSQNIRHSLRDQFSAAESAFGGRLR